MSVLFIDYDVPYTLLRIINCTNVTELISVMDTFFSNIGIVRYNYTHIDDEGRKRHFLWYNNYSQSWTQRYIARHYDTIDPAVFFIKLNNSSTTWKSACVNKVTSTYMSKTSKNLLNSMVEAVKIEGLENGIIIPIVSDTYRQHGFYLAFINEEKMNSVNILCFISAICMALNNKFLQFEYNNIAIKDEESNILTLKRNDEKIPLTEREQELIRLIYHGKERSDMAELMNISINTIDTMTKRIFLKMRVNTKVQLISKIVMKKWYNVLF